MSLYDRAPSGLWGRHNRLRLKAQKAPLWKWKKDNRIKICLLLDLKQRFACVQGLWCGLQGYSAITLCKPKYAIWPCGNPPRLFTSHTHAVYFFLKGGRWHSVTGSGMPLIHTQIFLVTTWSIVRHKIVKILGLSKANQTNIGRTTTCTIWKNEVDLLFDTHSDSHNDGYNDSYDRNHNEYWKKCKQRVHHPINNTAWVQTVGANISLLLYLIHQFWKSLVVSITCTNVYRMTLSYCVKCHSK